MMKKIILLISIFIACAGFSFAQSSARQNAKEETGKTDLKDSPVKILYKPKAAYPSQDGGTICFTGVVRLRVTFLDSGEIGEISVVSGLPSGATENAVAAAKKIKFMPAKKDGKNIMSTKVLEFSFSIF